MAIVDLGTVNLNDNEGFIYLTPVELKAEESYLYTITMTATVPRIIYSSFVLTHRIIIPGGLTYQALSYERFYFSDDPIQGVLEVKPTDDKEPLIAMGLGRFPYWNDPSKLSLITAQISLDDDKL